MINAGAEAYRGVIPPDCWHDPYMSETELVGELDQGVIFWGAYEAGELVGVMGLQDVDDVSLIRHAYVRPRSQRRGLGEALLVQLSAENPCPLLIGTWKDASWAVRFYEKHGFERIPARQTMALLKRYWKVPQRQGEESVVLADPRWFARSGATTS